MNKLWFKRMVGVLAVLVLLASCCLSPAAATDRDELQSQIDEQEAVQDSLNSDLDDLQAEMDVINDRITQLNSQIAEYNDAIAQYQSEIDSLEAKIEEAEKRQTELEAQISDTYELLGDRLYATYVAGSTSTLELLLSAEDFETFLTRLELVRRISEYDTSLVSDLQADIDELETTKTQLDADMAAVEQKQAAEQSARDALASDRAEELEARSLQESKQNDIEQKITDSEELQAELEAAMEAYDNDKASGMENGGGGAVDNADPSEFPVSSKGMICPLQYSNVYVSAGWYGYANHKGIDFCTRGATGNTYGKAIRAAADGVVYSAEYHYSWGNNVYINHGDGVYTRYAHCSSIVVSAGQTVKQGEIIAYVGNTGNVSPRPSESNPHAGAHLHFEVWVNGTRVNPGPWLP
ncbi:MAG TPA: peptidoglycan DD-metalloendopeptidase family protein [Candidatus Fimenecus stercoravium]|nr:peptidoglycan DD-metalloendopeptidase family protein [Candidatus Fimenecus stercoravium]